MSRGLQAVGLAALVAPAVCRGPVSAERYDVLEVVRPIRTRAEGT